MKFDGAYALVEEVQYAINEGEDENFCDESNRDAKSYALTQEFLKLGANEKIPAELAIGILESNSYINFFNVGYMVFDGKMYLQLPDADGEFRYIFPVEESPACEYLINNKNYENVSMHIGKYDVYLTYQSKDKINYIYVVDNNKHILLNMSTPDEFDNKENFGGTHNTIFDVANFSLVCMKMNQGIA
jgi:hypothetical protein